MPDILLSLVQVTSHDASKSFVEKVKADDKTFSSYEVGDFDRVRIFSLNWILLGRIPRARQ